MARSPMHWALLATLWLTLSSLAAAIQPANPIPEGKAPKNNLESTINHRDTNKFLLRIMPLGASITMGYKSTDGNGYREHIRQQLRYEGWQVDMVGSKRNGTMRNNHHEGHIGFRVDQVSQVAEKTIPKQPNLILINAGTNDALQKHSIDSIGTRMNSLITKLFNQINDTTIILSTLLPNKKQPKLVKEINKQYRHLAAVWRAKNARVVLADMSLVREDQLVDGVHPDDYGYKEMASVWWAAIQVAEAEGMLQHASNTSADGTIGVALEESLDDSTSDPDLPGYTAPAQPMVNGGISSRGLGMPWLGMLVMMFGFDLLIMDG